MSYSHRLHDTSPLPPLQPRHARSLDQPAAAGSSDATKAAAWMWHMHQLDKHPDYNSTREIRKRSHSFDRSGSRFRQEAASMTSLSPPPRAAYSQPAPPPQDLALSGLSSGTAESGSLWDCGSALYDTFELISVSNSLDRTLLGGVPSASASNSGPPPAPTPPSTGILRTLSLPLEFSAQEDSLNVLDRSSAHHASDPSSDPPNRSTNEAVVHGPSLSDSRGSNFQNYNVPESDAVGPNCFPQHQSLTARGALSKLASIGKKVLHTQLDCLGPNAIRRSFSGDRSRDQDIDTGTPRSQRSWRISSSYRNVEERRGDGVPYKEGHGAETEYRYKVYEEKMKWRKGGRHFHHHHHHYHYHFVHNVDQSNQAADERTTGNHPATMDVVSADRNVNLRTTETPRLSCGTLANICADVNCH